MVKPHRLGETLGRLYRRSQQGFDKTPGLGLGQLNRIVATNDFLSGIPDMGDHERGKR